MFNWKSYADFSIRNDQMHKSKKGDKTCKPLSSQSVTTWNKIALTSCLEKAVSWCRHSNVISFVSECVCYRITLYRLAVACIVLL